MSSATVLLVTAAAWCLLVPPITAWGFVLGMRDGSDDGGPGRGGPGPPGPLLPGLPSPPGPPDVCLPEPGDDSDDSGPRRRPPFCTTAVSSSTPPAVPTPQPVTLPSLPLNPVPLSSETTTTVVGRFSTIRGPTSATFQTSVSSQTVAPSSYSLVTGTTSNSSPLSTTFPMSTDSTATHMAGGSDSSMDTSNNRTLVITLSTVLSVVGVLLIGGCIFICCRYRRRRSSLFQRGITPIDDDEIETWKLNRSSEKYDVARPDFSGPSDYAWATPAVATSQAKPAMSSSVRKPPPSMIVYQNPNPQLPRRSEEFSPRSFASTSIGIPILGRSSVDKELPQAPAQARAPNSRAGLTDDTIPGDPSFIVSPRRQPSRLSKLPPITAHTRTRSSRSSTSMKSFIYANSDLELQVSPRQSNDMHQSSSYNSHSRVYSSSSNPPQLSFSDDGILGGLSPRPFLREDTIGRAIG